MADFVISPPLPPTSGRRGLALVAGARGAEFSAGGERLVAIGRNAPLMSLITSGAADKGGTTVKRYRTIGALSRVRLLLGNQSLTIGGNGTIEADAANDVLYRATLEWPIGTAVHRFAARGRETFRIGPASPALMTDDIGLYLPPGSDIAVRLMTRISVPPTSPAASAAAGGALVSGTTYFYKITAIDEGIESGPSAEVSAMVSGGNLAVQLSWTANPDAAAYRIYRGTATNAEVLIAELPFAATSWTDYGAAVPVSTRTPPAASTYKFNTACGITGDYTNHVSQGGNGSDQTGATGAVAGGVGPSFSYGVAPFALLGDDIASPSLLLLGDSIGAGRGFPMSAQVQPQLRNFFDAGLAAGALHSVNAAISGSADIMFTAPTSGAHGTNRTRLKLAEFATHILDENGINDVAYRATWQQLADDKLALGRLFHARGKPYFVTTLTPRVTMSDNGLTTAGQTTSVHEARRTGYNDWVRGGCRIDADGTPVLSGGRSALGPGQPIAGYVDLAGAVEVDADNILTPNGGHWRVPAAASQSGLVLTGTPTAIALAVAGTPFAAGWLVGQVVKMTSGARAGQVAVIRSNTAGALALYPHGDTSQSGIAVTGLSGAPSAGDTFDIWNVYCNEGLHPALAGHDQMAAAVTQWKAALFG